MLNSCILLCKMQYNGTLFQEDMVSVKTVCAVCNYFLLTASWDTS